MKILSWNVNRNNTITTNTIEKIREMNCGIIMLQEVNKLNLDKIIANFPNYSVFTAREIISTFKSKIKYYLVTMVKKDINCDIVSVKSTKLLSFREFIYKISFRKIDIEYLSVLVCVNKVKIDLINCHLQYATSPSKRKIQLDFIKKNTKINNYVIAGDFNTFSKFPLSLIIGIFFGYSKKDFLTNEVREIIESDPDTKNGSHMHTTSIYSISRLDWICVSKEISLLSDEVFKSRLGSDHYPIVAEIRT